MCCFHLRPPMKPRLFSLSPFRCISTELFSDSSNKTEKCSGSEPNGDRGAAIKVSFSLPATLPLRQVPARDRRRSGEKDNAMFSLATVRAHDKSPVVDIIQIFDPFSGGMKKEACGKGSWQKASCRVAGPMSGLDEEGTEAFRIGETTGSDEECTIHCIVFP